MCGIPYKHAYFTLLFYVLPFIVRGTDGQELAGSCGALSSDKPWIHPL